MNSVTELTLCRFFITAILIISLASGCESESGFGSGGGGMGGIRISITEVSGNNQEVAPGGNESEPIVVQVTDLDDTPIDGINIVWEIDEGDGSLSSDSGVTDEDGYAQTTYISGDTTGDVEIIQYYSRGSSSEGTMMGQSNSSVVFTITVN